MNDKIKTLPGGNEPDVTMEAVRQMKKQLPAMIEYYKTTAKMHRIKYESLIEEGFTSDEALELCKLLY